MVERVLSMVGSRRMTKMFATQLHVLCPSNSRFLRVDLWATRTRRRNPPRSPARRRSATIFVTGTRNRGIA